MARNIFMLNSLTKPSGWDRCPCVRGGGGGCTGSVFSVGMSVGIGGTCDRSWCSGGCGTASLCCSGGIGLVKSTIGSDIRGGKAGGGCNCC